MIDPTPINQPLNQSIINSLPSERATDTGLEVCRAQDIQAPQGGPVGQHHQQGAKVALVCHSTFPFLHFNLSIPSLRFIDFFTFRFSTTFIFENKVPDVIKHKHGCIGFMNDYKIDCVALVRATLLRMHNLGTSGALTKEPLTKVREVFVVHIVRELHGDWRAGPAAERIHRQKVP